MHDLYENEKKVLIDIVKRIPGYNTHITDRNGNDLFVGDEIKIYHLNNDYYISGKICYDKETSEFCIETERRILYNNIYSVNCFYFIKLKDNEKIKPYIEQDRIEKVSRKGKLYIPELNSKYYMDLIENKKYKEFYDEIDELDTNFKIRLTNDELDLINRLLEKKKIKFSNKTEIQISIISEFHNEDIFQFIRKNIMYIKDSIELEINQRTCNTGVFNIANINVKYRCIINQYEITNLLLQLSEQTELSIDEE